MISDTLKEISSKYLDEKNTPIANNEFAGFVRDVAQKYIKPKVMKNREHYYFKSSPGRPPHWASRTTFEIVMLSIVHNFWLNIFLSNISYKPCKFIASYRSIFFIKIL